MKRVGGGGVLNRLVRADGGRCLSEWYGTCDSRRQSVIFVLPQAQSMTIGLAS